MIEFNNLEKDKFITNLKQKMLQKINNTKIGLQTIKQSELESST